MPAKTPEITPNDSAATIASAEQESAKDAPSAASAPSDGGDTARYRVLSPILHDERRYDPDDVIVLAARAAKPLLAVNAIEAE